MDFCLHCGRELLDELSKKRGYGPTCYKRRQPRQKKFPFATQFPVKQPKERRYKQCKK